MKPLWAPWRMEYVSGHQGREPGCIFEVGNDRPHHKAGLVLFRDQTAVVLLNRYPYANGHLLVAPCRHLEDISDLSVAEGRDLMTMVTKSTQILRRHLRPDGLNIGLNLGAAAGAGISDHLHFHVVPRWQGDHNFITVLAEVRTIPEHLDATYERLLPDFVALTASPGQ